MPDRPLVLMAVHAHPDDEATSTGGVLAMYAEQGIETVLVTCTDGGCGDGPGGAKPEHDAHDSTAVVAMRQAELEASCALLGVTHLELLGYADSGMMGWATNDAPGAFWSTPVDEAAAKLAVLMRKYRPDVVVTYDEFGFYGHPDHIQAHRITMAAVEATGLPSKVYWTTVPRSKFEEFGALLRELGMADELPTGATGEADDAGDPMPQIGLPDDQITTWVDTSAYGGTKFDALAAHSSQSENIFFLQLGRERFTEMMGVETFVRVRDTTGAPVPEDDLFAGLR
ncbi:MAG: PIG-L family deacetylase [Jatrophihabitans sp.]